MEIKLRAKLRRKRTQEPPIYRLWIDHQLYIERKYPVDDSIDYVEELMIVELELGEHELKLEKIGHQGQIFIDNLLIENKSYTTDLGLERSNDPIQIIKFNIV